MNQNLRNASKTKGNLPKNPNGIYQKSFNQTTRSSFLEPEIFADILESSISEESAESTISAIVLDVSQKEIREKTLRLKLAKCNNLKHKFKIVDTTIIFLALTGLGIAIYDFEVTYADDFHLRFQSSDFSDRIKFFISVTTAVCLMLSVFRSYYSYSLVRERSMLLEDKITDYFHSHHFVVLVIDILIISVHCPPYINFVFEFKQLNGLLFIDFNSICLSIMILRVLLMFRLLIHYSKWSSLKVQQICEQNEVHNPMIFALKSCLKESPHILLIPAFLISTVALGVALQIYERPFNQDNYSPGNGYFNYTYLYNAEWLILLTMTTVGYGDFYPRTHVGRFVAIVACIWGTFLISLMIIMLNEYVSFSLVQQKSYKILKKMNDYQGLRKTCSSYIKCAVEIFMYKKFHDLDDDNSLIKVRKLRMKYYSKLKEQYKKDIFTKNVDERDALIQLNDSFAHDLSKLNRTLRKALDMNDQLDTLLARQKKILESLSVSKRYSNEVVNLINYSSVVDN